MRSQVRLQEQPFALAAVGSVLATVASLCSETLASLGSLYLGGLERLLRLANSPSVPISVDLGQESQKFGVECRWVAHVWGVAAVPDDDLPASPHGADQQVGVRLRDERVVLTPGLPAPVP